MTRVCLLCVRDDLVVEHAHCVSACRVKRAEVKRADQIKLGPLFTLLLLFLVISVEAFPLLTCIVSRMLTNNGHAVTGSYARIHSSEGRCVDLPGFAFFSGPISFQNLLSSFLHAPRASWGSQLMIGGTQNMIKIRRKPATYLSSSES